MVSLLQGLIEAIHASPVRCVLYVAGAGSSAIAQLTGVAGCSQTLLEARVPYAAITTFRMLDDRPSRLVAAPVARQLAQHAYHRAVDYSGGDDETIVGIGSTAAVQTNRIRRGKDCAFVAVWCQRHVVEFAMELPRHLPRAEQEGQVALLLLKALAECAKVPFEIPLEVEPARQCYTVPAFPLRCFFQGETAFVVFNKHGEVRAGLMPYVAEASVAATSETSVRQLLFPGSFHPLHWGHTELARTAARTVAGMVEPLNSAKSPTSPTLCNKPEPRSVRVTYEISVDNADKGVVESEVEIEKRVQQFREHGARVAVTRARLFIEKAMLFPGYGFIVGIDTMKRIIDPKYYNNSTEAMLHAMQTIRMQGCYFVVAGRASGKGDAVWEDLASIDVPAELRSMFIPIQQGDFRVDVSSTALREKGRGV
ncbi:nucleotidyl transferase domain-containing protein [Trypanosoma rangeli]|uniref:Nucleotidyl transferase domain-containing protein n=1 Tax=Trypanosoma rangeli TaxID=5698 RepID=A0A3R7NIM4_TRYRA|nr:nucleotidyl transferase domain-containing protein [Trypanosoma rangeli]RNF03174.1 nucleotidyl transferase domain-containing protein [Trypanosoma rangeli]|eukprot:RNF03174.1 nucleotidyl transferase domain-containing protein [Trypanosoma rangeli]